MATTYICFTTDKSKRKPKRPKPAPPEACYCAPSGDHCDGSGKIKPVGKTNGQN